MSARSNYDKYLAIFSPEGRLYQVEYAFNAIKSPALTCIAVRAKDGAVVVSQRKVPDKLLKAESVTHLFNITDSIGCAVVGRIADGKSMISMARNEALEFLEKNQYEIPVSVLARRMGDIAQVYTQYSGMRPMGVALLFLSMELQDNGEYLPKVFKVDPAGFCVGCFAAAVGQKDVEAVNQLEKKYKAKRFDLLDVKEATSLALGCLQTTLGTDFKAPELEVGIASVDNTEFRRLSDEDVEAVLAGLAERD